MQDAMNAEIASADFQAVLRGESAAFGELEPDEMDDVVLALFFTSLYRVVDSDRSNTLTAPEMKECLELLGLEPTARQVERIIAEVDGGREPV